MAKETEKMTDAELAQEARDREFSGMMVIPAGHNQAFPMSQLADIRAQEQSVTDEAGDEMAADLAEAARVQTAREKLEGVTRAEGIGYSEIGRVAMDELHNDAEPWSDDDLERLSVIEPQDVHRAIDAATPKVRSMVTARPDVDSEVDAESGDAESEAA